MTDDVEVSLLETFGIVGFDGQAIDGIQVHPNGTHVVYPMGNKVVIQNWRDKKMAILTGHSNLVVALAISPDGKFVGSGQVNHIGFNAPTILWDFHKRLKLSTHDLHKVRVECITFSSDDRYMISVGGRDDGTIVVYDTHTMSAVSTASATRQTSGDAFTVVAFNRRPNSFITAGDGNLRVWNMSMSTKVLEPWDVAVGKLKRCYKSCIISEDDAYGYAGTTTGDIVKFSIGYPDCPSAPLPEAKPSMIGCFAKCGRWRKGKSLPDSLCYSQGVTAMEIMDDGCLLVGSGGGKVDLLDSINWTGKVEKEKLLRPNFPYFRPLRSTKLNGSITSMKILESPATRTPDREVLVGTLSCEIYSINIATFVKTLVVTCHRCAINDLAFPRGMSDVFATAGTGDVRIWNLGTCQELLRIQVPNFICTCVLFTHDGKCLLSTWNDGCIRGFTPLTGRLMFTIRDAHNKGVSALDVTSTGKILISGGCEGQVRIWDMKSSMKTLMKVLKEHKSPVSAIQVSPGDVEAVSAATDGSCIIWDLHNLSRRQVLYANTLFTTVCYEPKGCQILTGGSDRRVAYWEAASGSLARELEATKQGAVNGLDINKDGYLFVTVGTDQLVKVWLYQEGIFTHIGKGHAAAVTCCKFSPDSKYIVSACAAGTVIVWKTPEEYLNRKTQPPEEVTPAEGAKEEELELKLTSQEAPKQPSKTTSTTKIENIGSMDTSREPMHVTCPCGLPLAQVVEKTCSKQSSAKTNKSDTSCKVKPKVCVPAEYLPTRTTSKCSVQSRQCDKC